MEWITKMTSELGRALPSDDQIISNLLKFYDSSLAVRIFFISVGNSSRRVAAGEITWGEAANSLGKHAVELGRQLETGELT